MAVGDVVLGSIEYVPVDERGSYEDPDVTTVAVGEIALGSIEYNPVVDVDAGFKVVG